MSEDLPSIHHQRLELKVSAMESKLSDFQASIDVFREQIKYISDDETKSARNLKYFITSVITLGVGLFVFIGYVNYSVNTAQISDKLSFEVSKVEDKLKDLGDKGEIISASTTSPYSKGNYIIGTSYISRDTVDSGLYAYSLKIEFRANVSVTGESVGALIGVYRKYEGAYADLMSLPTNKIYTEGLTNGNNSYLPGVLYVVQGYPQSITWEETISKAKCKDVEDLLSKVRHTSNLGYVYVQPIFGKIKNTPELTKFNIEVSDVNSIYSCDSFK